MKSYLHCTRKMKKNVKVPTFTGSDEEKWEGDLKGNAWEREEDRDVWEEGV